MAERGDDARAEQHRVVRCDGAEQVADDEDADHAEQRALARDRHDERRDHRGADDDAEGVARDEQTGTRDRDAEVARDVGQEPHDHELGGADAERRGGQRDDGEGHRRIVARPA
jgi:hypothetical protein